jgi:hypothetical protein
MHSKIILMILAGAGVLGGTRSARAATPTGLEVGFRTGYAIPFGNAEGSTGPGADTSMSDVINGVVPLWFDAGYRFDPHMMVGGFFQFAPGFVNTGKVAGCTVSGVSCSLNDLMLGFQFHYHILPEATFDPWAGVGVGYEFLNFND